MYFFKVLRPINLMIILFTMIGGAVHLFSTNTYQYIRFNTVDFGLLIFSTLLIAGAGNLINDYFDIKADRINKPSKLIIGKYIKKRWAILLHWIFNGVAVGISIYLSFKYQSLWFVFVYVVTGNLLWYYSTTLKKRAVYGNLVIAAMTALIPFLVILFFKVSNESNEAHSPYHSDTWSTDLNYKFLYLLALCAFLTNMAREIIKDIEDMKGDLAIQVKSLPMLIGENKAYWLAVLIAQMSGVACLISFIFFKNTFTVNDSIWIILVLCGVLNLLLFIFPLIKKTTIKHCSLLLKVSLFLGICSLYFSS